MRLRSIENFCRNWLLNHPDIDSIILTIKRLYIDPFGNPYCTVIEYKPIVPYTVLGWTVETRIIPLPSKFKAEILVNTATKLKERGFYDMALYYYRRALEIKPNLKQAWNNLGDLYNKLGLFDEAVKCLNKALELNPKYDLVLINLGIAIAQTGKIKLAMKYFNKALELNPQNERAWYIKAIMLYTLGNYKEAYECVIRALKINPHYEHAKMLMKTLKEQCDLNSYQMC
ncbi:MAG: tetratricopeptide repeat protein [archaeon GB-1867-035]|nr:tetratricopeptide repeat protein [Candidatus Culexmicrobium profundum]